MNSVRKQKIPTYVKASSGTGTSPVVMLDDLSFPLQRLVEIILRFKALFFVQSRLMQRINVRHPLYCWRYPYRRMRIAAAVLPDCINLT